MSEDSEHAAFFVKFVIEKIHCFYFATEFTEITEGKLKEIGDVNRESQNKISYLTCFFVLVCTSFCGLIQIMKIEKFLVPQGKKLNLKIHKPNFTGDYTG
jgi:site-specific DNA-adenine methylase